MKKYLVISLLAAFSFGFGGAIQSTGIDAGWGFYPTIICYGVGYVFWMVAVFWSIPKLKGFITEKEQQGKEAKEKEIINSIGENLES